ncbi:uncharacterized protein LOC123395992 isoform X3 [Hordeum vulgare subsp. vulgare]|uniref:uncharacterized protein LOC123395992 isoform X3 n=1 Tax=Hordeum vulgare subsp. vulgare TaxID=112509 RepID=UPI001D1A3CF9|nr:uncharacterized protein LOC123395992 isoform X3 [Hordeum vulgare subsp. vulgare]
MTTTPGPPHSVPRCSDVLISSVVGARADLPFTARAAKVASIPVPPPSSALNPLRELLLQDRNLQWIKRLGLRYIKRTSRYFISQHAGL